MTRKEFQHALHLGLGRAIVYARGHKVRRFRDLILDACLHCRAYDAQTEGTRAAYMHDLVACLPDKAFYRDAVLQSLPDSGDGYDAVHRFHIAACLAFDGDEQARRAMYASYRPGPRMGEQIGIDFLKMDGIAGLLFVAEKIGALLAADPAGVDAGFLLSQSLEICGDHETWDALREAGAANPSIETYRTFAAEQHRRWAGARGHSPAVRSLTYEQLKEIPKNKPYLLWKWGEQASDEDLNLAARGLIAAKDPKQQLAHLRIFARRPFPLDPRPLLDLVDVETDRIGPAALKALGNVSHPDVRALAFRLVDTRAGGRGDAIALIAANFQPGDHALVLRWFCEEDDSETLHSMGMDLLHLWERHPDEESVVSMLRSLYERGPCSECRQSAVEELLERDALDDEMRAECAWDSNYEIRDLVGSPQTPTAA